MASDRFRQQLKTEARQWLDEGAIAPEHYAWLKERYGFDGLALAARSRYLMLLLGLGCTLIGLGAIAFVAANWQTLSREVRVAMLLGALLGANGLGFYWWRGLPRFPGQGRAGAALLLLGSILIGPNVGLMAQMFHQGGPSATLFAVWSLGAGAMAAGLGLSPLGGLSLLLAAIAWGSSLNVYGETLPLWLTLTTERAPLVFLFGFGPLAIACQSRLMFGAAIAMGAVSLVQVWAWSGLGPVVGGLSAIALLVLPLWGYRDRLGQRWLPRTENFEGVARRLAIGWLSVGIFALSFYFPWEPWSHAAGDLNRAAAVGQVAAGLTIALVLLWTAAARRGQLRDRETRQLLALLAIAVAIGTVHTAVMPIPGAATFGFNSLLFLLAIAVARWGLDHGDRLGFWGGGLLLAAQVASRTFEYDTGLIIKAIAFVLCGVGVIVAGLIFERSLPTLADSDDPDGDPTPTAPPAP